MGESKEIRFTRILAIVYFCILIWILLFKLRLPFEEVYHSRSINLIPFSGSAIVNGRIDISEIINNVLIFVPVGIYTCMIKKNLGILKKMSVAFFISLMIEVLQFILAIGATDVTDLISNTLGGVIGIGVFYLFDKVLKDKAIKTFNIYASVCTIGLVSMLGMLILVNI